ncbi:FAD-dependent oxidoreductase [Streptomyces marincola]|uniref:FAD-dependent oxidoreductase n=1 Tax=Streptomyces marincola TaxID=2878388 RepID=UPI001CF2CAB6|nr:FAD-dependent oxidoreductase [Streptomyces marincola]UCM87450.1 FAD-dependent oxidoreductase [Streptomyces marincola]
MLKRRTPRAFKDIADIVVVGGGTAGLAAAHHLTAAGLTVVLLEAADDIGGRMTTERRDGFRLDRSGPLSLTDSPALRRLPRPLPLRPLTGGVLLCGPDAARRIGGSAGRRHRHEGEPAGSPPGGRPPGAPDEQAADRDGPAFDRVWLKANLARLGRSPGPRPRGSEPTAAGALRTRGIPPRIAESSLRPLLSALLHDPDLATSSRLGDLALRAFARHGLGLPAGGAAALPGLLAACLPPGAVRTGVRVESVSTTEVTTRAHGTFACRGVVVATGAAEAARLLPGLRVPAFRPVTVLHHAAPDGVRSGATLVVEAAGRGPLAHSLAASAADPSRAPEGRTLVTSVVLGHRAAEPAELLDKAARPQLTEMHQAPADDWELLAAHHDPQAVPAVPPPYTGARSARLLDGLYVCGDHRDAPGPSGDLASARRAASAVLADAGLAPAAAG